MGGDDHHQYPYARYDECSWHPEEVARRLGDLVSPPSPPSSTPPIVHENRRGGGHRRGGSERADDAILPTTTTDNNTRLLTRGRSANEIRALRRVYGGNTLHGDHLDDDDDDDGNKNNANRSRRPSAVVVSLTPILRAFYDQLKEPLILMLLFSASISLCLGNGADALSIGMALVIVSLVAAVQEYRSERGEPFVSLFFFYNASDCARVRAVGVAYHVHMYPSPEGGSSSFVGGGGGGGGGNVDISPRPFRIPPLNGHRPYCHFWNSILTKKNNSSFSHIMLSYHPSIWSGVCSGSFRLNTPKLSRSSPTSSPTRAPSCATVVHTIASPRGSSSSATS